MIDMRNAAAMNNFVHKSNSANNRSSDKATIRLHAKATGIEQKNKLESLILLRLNKKNTQIPLIINDFPRLKKKELLEKIFLSPFTYRMCQTYFDDFEKKEMIFFI